jgi:uncharacterized membrane protein YqiK
VQTNENAAKQVTAKLNQLSERLATASQQTKFIDGYKIREFHNPDGPKLSECLIQLFA